MTTQWLGDDESKPAPGPLRRVQGLINTIDRESGRDRLARAEDAEPWLAANDLIGTGERVDSAELRLLVEVREALRALLVRHTDGSAIDPETVEPLRALAADVAVRAVIGPDGQVDLVAEGNSVRSRLVGLLLVVAAAQRDGTWAHLMACANDDCRWAFYDRSRNHGGTWCTMATCGNKLKNRDFRARRRAEA
jgi:predicted RNA-binding Zn ribbon-like protein